MVPAGKPGKVADVAITMAAMTGPTPNSPVRLVPAAATVIASFLRVRVPPDLDFPRCPVHPRIAASR